MATSLQHLIPSSLSLFLWTAAQQHWCALLHSSPLSCFFKAQNLTSMLEKNNTHQCIQHIGAGMMETEQNAVLEYGPRVWSCLFFYVLGFWLFVSNRFSRLLHLLMIGQLEV